MIGALMVGDRDYLFRFIKSLSFPFNVNRRSRRINVGLNVCTKVEMKVFCVFDMRRSEKLLRREFGQRRVQRRYC
ncbi:hypothetical protein TSAR_000495 [Trichomalopsis sarcophagae]|uniref:Uncharacterized protein n=1 Tax=Trichomalopsis sarcophagae TaxID=543379 RepID=A0A232EWF7_9HYME|nr:hypothetical protein TSAR_000495 [Trichomalopsis sarcophagae]